MRRYILSLSGSYVDETTAVFAFSEENCTVNESVECVVLAHANILTGVVNCTTLTFEDVTCFSVLTAKNLNAESFAL